MIKNKNKLKGQAVSTLGNTNLFSLTDLHKLSGGAKKHRPNYFLTNVKTKKLIQELENSDRGVITPLLQKDRFSDMRNEVLKVINGGLNRGTYVCKELFYAYAMWIGVEFALMVVRGFDDLISQTDSDKQPNLASNPNLASKPKLQETTINNHMSNLYLQGQAVSTLGNTNLYSLNDLHKLSGGAKKHKPSNFFRSDSTKALIQELENSDRGVITPLLQKECFSNMSITPVKIIKGNLATGEKQGTYVCKELVYAYAMWVSAKFSLMVIRAFDSLVNPTGNYQVPQIKPNPHLAIKTKVEEVARNSNLNYGSVYRSLYNAFQVTSYKDIPAQLVNNVLEYLNNLKAGISRQETTQEAFMRQQKQRAFIEQKERISTEIIGFNDKLKDLEEIRERLIKVLQGYEPNLSSVKVPNYINLIN